MVGGTIIVAAGASSVAVGTISVAVETNVSVGCGVFVGTVTDTENTSQAILETTNAAITKTRNV